jgi:hypothetical protein
MNFPWFGRNTRALPGDHKDEMTPFDVLDDDAMDVLASGHFPPGRDDLAGVAAFAAALRDVAAASTRPSAELAALLAEGLSPAEDRGTVASRSSAGRHRMRRKPAMLETALAKLGSLGFAAKASAVVVGLLATTTGVAAAGGLPDAAQEAAADAVSAISPFEIPRADEAAERAENQPANPANSANNDPEANDHGQAVADTARTTDAEGCERGHEVAEAAGGHPADCADPAGGGPADAPEQAADTGRQHRDAAADASQLGQDNTADVRADTEHRDEHADDAGQRGTDAAEAGAANASDSRP